MLAERGFQLVPQALPRERLPEIQAEAQRLQSIEPDAAHGIRDLLKKSPLLRAALEEPWLARLIPPGHVCVRGILFDKTASANWLVAWHQDLTICVQAQQQISGYGPWSVKHGIPHVQPPASLLERMVTVRLHLDDARADNGALRVLPGSHLQGKLDASQIEQMRTAAPEMICGADAGDALLMKPLLLHASSRAAVPAHRRVVHLEFAPKDGLAEGLSWYECVV